MQIINSIPKSWLYVTCGALIGGLAIRYIGFQGSRQRCKGLHKFCKMCLWYLNGVTVTSFTTIILRLNPITKEILEKYPKITFIISMIGFFRSFPQLMVLQRSDSSFSWKTYLPWIIFWHFPAAYFACFTFRILSYSMKYSIALISMCFTIGTIIPLKNSFISDLGFKITSSSLLVFVFGMIMRLFSEYSHITLLFVVNAALIVLFSGLLIDDLQHIKYKLENENEDENEDEEDTTSIPFNPIRKSVPIFIETILIFGRIASLLSILSIMKIKIS